MSTLDLIQSRKARLAVIGAGYVGLPLSTAFAEAGFQVTAIDIDPGRVAAINRGDSYVQDVPSDRLGPLVSARPAGGSLRATSSYDAVSESEAVIVCVPTPLSKTKVPDLSYIVAAADAIAGRMRPGTLVVLESTTYPGTTEELVLPKLRGPGPDGMTPGRDFFLAFSPERIDPGNRHYTVRNTPKVVGGLTPDCLRVALALYGSIVDNVVPVSSTRVAEMVKLLENTFRATNIALVNEIAIICDRLDIDVWEVIEAAKTKPYGFMPFYPGPGLGGHCIPIDPQYLAWKLRSMNYEARFIQLAEEINFGMPRYVGERVADALNDDRKSINGSSILVLGVAYKADVADARESPAIDLIEILRRKGANVAYNDPYVPVLSLDGSALESTALSDSTLASADCVVITTPHSVFDWPRIVGASRLIVDTRNATAGVKRPGARIVKL